MDPVQDRFTAALVRLEAERDPQQLVELFADDAELSKLGHHTTRGRDGARRFWTEYRDAFGEIRSTFSAVTVGGDRVVLEWTAEGTLPDGHPLRYAGVSVLEVDGDRVRGFRTYHDSAPFVSGLSASRTPAGESG